MAKIVSFSDNRPYFAMVGNLFYLELSQRIVSFGVEQYKMLIADYYYYYYY